MPDTHDFLNRPTPYGIGRPKVLLQPVVIEPTAVLENHLVAVSDIKIAFGTVLGGPFYDRVPEFDHFLHRHQTGAVVASDFLKIIFCHFFDDMLPFWIHRSERGDVETSVKTVHVLAADDLVLSEFTEGQNRLVATAGYTDDPLVLDVEVKGLLSAGADEGSAVKIGCRTPVVKLVDLAGLQLDQLSLMGNPVASLGGFEFCAHEKIDAGRIEGARNVDRNLRVVF
jgi:hypothetical protein